MEDRKNLIDKLYEFGINRGLDSPYLNLNHDLKINKGRKNWGISYYSDPENYNLNTTDFMGKNPIHYLEELILLKKKISELKNKSIATIPSSYGSFVAYLSEIEKANAMGVDLNPMAVKVAQYKAINVHEGNAENLKMIDDETIDAIVSKHFLDICYINNPQTIKNILTEFKRILKPEGIMIITETSELENFFKESDLGYKLEKSGYIATKK